MASRLAETVRELAPRLAERDIADAEHYPADNIRDLVNAGVIRAPFPAAAGGAGSTLLDAVEVIASASPSTALPAAMPIGLAGAYSAGPDAAPPAHRRVGFPNFIEIVQPLTYWFALFSAIPLGCAAAIRIELSTPAPESPALRPRFADAQMREEALRAYPHETARVWTPGAGPSYAARALRRKRYVTQEAMKLCAELFAMSGGRHYRRDGPLARALAASFAGTALRPPLPPALDTLVRQFPGE